ncbi:MAG: oligosaccharide flippase family protein [Thermofilaceae archaeon]
MGGQSRISDAASESALVAFSLFGGQVLATFVAGISSIILARILGPEGYGRYSLAPTVAGLLMLGTGFGTTAALTREVSRAVAQGDSRSAAQLVGVVLRFNLLASLGAAAVGFALAEQLSQALLNRPDLAPLARLMLPLVIVDTLFNVASAALLGLSDAKALALLPVARDAVRSVASPLLALRFGCEGALAGFVAGHAAAAALGVAMLKARFRELRAAPWGELRPLLRYGLPLYTSVALSTSLATYQNSIIAWVATDEEVGNLKVAANFVALLQLVSFPISSALFPAFSRMEKGEAGRAFRYAAKYSSLVLVPAGAFTIVAARDLVRLVYGGAYALAPAYLSLNAVSLLWSGLGSAVLASFFQGIGETRVLFAVTLTNAALFVPLSAALAPWLGVFGVIIATLLSNLASTLYGLREAVKRDASIDWRTAVLVCASALSAAAVVVVLGHLRAHYILRLAASAAAFLAAYGALLPLTGCLERADLESLEAAFSREPLRTLARPVLKLESVLLRATENLLHKTP